MEFMELIELVILKKISLGVWLKVKTNIDAVAYKLNRAPRNLNLHKNNQTRQQVLLNKTA